jgi:RNA recognition motif-containing protein
MNGKVGTPMSSAASEQSKSMHGSSTPQQSAIDENAYNKIFVGGLHYDTRDRKLFDATVIEGCDDSSAVCFPAVVEEFRDYFSRFGKVVYGEVMFNRETHKSRGFGFIVFENAESALRACDVREHILDGKVVRLLPSEIVPPCRFTVLTLSTVALFGFLGGSKAGHSSFENRIVYPRYTVGQWDVEHGHDDAVLFDTGECSGPHLIHGKWIISVGTVEWKQQYIGCCAWFA